MEVSDNFQKNLIQFLREFIQPSEEFYVTFKKISQNFQEIS